jgi:creatinine amidohydrolase/Fe(II)-dependent formamide hydrolase-like protein
VRVGAIPSAVSEQPDWSAERLDFTTVSTTGVVGDARHASAALGEKLWDACVASVAATIEAIALERA